DSIRAFVLQGIGANLVDDAYASSFLLLINDCAPSLTLYHFHRATQLTAAVALHRAEHIARQTLRMNTNQSRNIRAQIALVKHYELLGAGERAIARDAELADFSRQPGVRYALYRQRVRSVRACHSFFFFQICHSLQ